MKQTEKSRPGGNDTRTAVEQVQASRQGHASNFNFTTPPQARQIQIADLLLRGQQNAIPLRHLKELTGLPGRDIRRRIQEERLLGTPILSDNQRGYFLPADDGERARFVRSMRSRAREIESAAAAVEEAEIS